MVARTLGALDGDYLRDSKNQPLAVLCANISDAHLRPGAYDLTHSMGSKEAQCGEITIVGKQASVAFLKNQPLAVLIQHQIKEA